MEVLVADTFSESKLREFSFKIDWEKGKADKTCKENSLARKVHKERLLLQGKQMQLGSIVLRKYITTTFLRN